MKKNKILIIIICILILGVIVSFIISHTIKINQISNETYDYTPEEEISEEQMRQTTVTLYFLDVNTNSLKTEGRLIDSATLIENPYKTLTQLLIDGPQSENLKSVIPENTQIIDATLENSNTKLNFSPELLNYIDDTQKYNIINSILNTLSQLNEVNSITININGELNANYSDTYSIIH